MQTIYLAGGCFWGVQKYFDQFEGVMNTETGYANGPEGYEHVSYEEVCQSSGHAETLKIEWDDERLTLDSLLDFYFMIVDPTSINRQGHDTGVQYRTGIYYTDSSQLPIIEEVMRREQEKYPVPLAVEIQPLRNFFPAEEYHQKYLDKNPGGYCHIPARMFQIKASP